MGHKPNATILRFVRRSALTRQFGMVIAVLSVGALLSAGLFSLLRGREWDLVRGDFGQASEERIATLWKALESDMLQLSSVQAFLLADETVTPKEFATFVAPLLEGRKGIRAIHWAPRATLPNGDSSFPISFVTPPDRTNALLGRNLATMPDCQEAVRQSLKTGRAAMGTSPCPRDKRCRVNVKIVVPVCRQNVSTHAEADHNTRLHGFVVGMLCPADIGETSLRTLTPAGIDISLKDTSGSPIVPLLYRHSSRRKATGDAPTPARPLRLSKTWDVAGRRWTVTCTAAPQFAAARLTWFPWGGAAAGLVLSALLAAYLANIARHGVMTTNLALQLTVTNRQLQQEIADRKRVETTLRDSERWYRLFAENVADVIWIMDLSGRYTYFSPSVREAMGYTPEEGANLTIVDTMSPATRPVFRASLDRLQAAVAAGQPAKDDTIEVEKIRKDGSTMWGEVTLGAMYDESGNFVAVQGVTRDITERKAAEQRQSRSLRRLERVNRLQEELLLPDTLPQKLQKITKAAVDLLELDFCRVWAIKPGDRCHRDCIHAMVTEGPHRCRHRNRCLHLMASSGRYTNLDGDHSRVPFGCYKIGRIASGEEKKFLTNDVTTDPRVHNHQWAESLALVSFAGYKLRDANSNPTGVLAMFAAHPISEEDDAFLSSLAEIASKVILDDKAAEILRCSERRHRLFAENVNDVIWTMELSGQLNYVSPSVERVLGFKWNECSPLTIAQMVEPSQLPMIHRIVAGLAAVANSGQRVSGGSVEVQLTRKDGSIIWSENTYSGAYDESGALVGIQGITRDITVRRQMEDELRQAKEAAEAATEAKSRFLANMSHEIRTPMTSILGYADLLMDPSIGDSDRNNFLAVIRRNGEYLLGLINDILDLSRIEAGKLSIELCRCNVVSLVAGVATLIRPRALQRNLALAVQYQGQLPETILTDDARLRQALVNLVGNAVKFTEQGSVRITVAFLPQWRNGPPAIQFDVIDTGIGIQPEVLSQLFRPFTQADSSVSRKFGGSGLGLAISRHIVEMLGGELVAASALGHGSTFTLTIPTGSLDGVAMHSPAAGDLDADAATSVEPPATNVLAGARVLLAEDGYDNRELIQIVLRGAGASVETVVNGQEAIDRAQTQQFDVILMDMNMPVMDGCQATQTLRDRGYTGPILALTASVMPSDTDRCKAAGCNEHLTKPIDRATLMERVKFYADNRSATAPPRRLPPPTPRSIVSLLIDDPDVAAILPGFIGRLSGQLESMRAAFSADRYEDLQRHAHQLKGAGGCYGYPSLTDAGRALEQAAKQRDVVAANEGLDAVAALCHAIQDGYESVISAGRT